MVKTRLRVAAPSWGPHAAARLAGWLSPSPSSRLVLSRGELRTNSPSQGLAFAPARQNKPAPAGCGPVRWVEGQQLHLPPLSTNMTPCVRCIPEAIEIVLEAVLKVLEVVLYMMEE